MVGHRSVAESSFSLVWRFKALLSAVIASLCASPVLARDWYTGLVDPVTGYS